jgi:hypothetical protein
MIAAERALTLAAYRTCWIDRTCKKRGSGDFKAAAVLPPGA